MSRIACRWLLEAILSPDISKTNIYISNSNFTFVVGVGILGLLIESVGKSCGLLI